MYFDPVYMLFMIPALILAGIASAMTKGTFNKYSKVSSRSQLTGAQAARQMLDRNGLHDVVIHRARGFLSDHYNPANRTLNLSPDVYDSPSLSAIGVACHEAGHALQHAQGYVPLQIRSAMVPVTQFSSYGAYIFILLGMFMRSPVMAQFGVVLFAVGFLFALVTLPVEWDASARAKKTDGHQWHCGLGRSERCRQGAERRLSDLRSLRHLRPADPALLHDATRPARRAG